MRLAVLPVITFSLAVHFEPKPGNALPLLYYYRMSFRNFAETINVSHSTQIKMLNLELFMSVL